MKQWSGKVFGWVNGPSRAVAFAAILFVAVLLGRDALSSWKVNIEIDKLKKRKAELERSIEADSVLLRSLDDPEFLERYARERYLMRRAGDDVFVVEEE